MPQSQFLAEIKFTIGILDSFSKVDFGRNRFSIHIEQHGTQDRDLVFILALEFEGDVISRLCEAVTPNPPPY